MKQFKKIKNAKLIIHKIFLFINILYHINAHKVINNYTVFLTTLHNIKRVKLFKQRFSTSDMSDSQYLKIDDSKNSYL